MAKDTYKKRSKGSWREGKSYKGDSEERQHAKREIEESVKYDHENNPVRHKGKRKRNEKASLEYWIDYYTRKIVELEKSENFITASHFRVVLKRRKEEYSKKYGNNKP